MTSYSVSTKASETDVLNTHDTVQALFAAAEESPCVPLSQKGRDQALVLARLASLYRSGIISQVVLNLWQEHTDCNRRERPVSSTTTIRLFAKDSRSVLVQPALEEFFKSNPVCVVDSLGDNLSAICFTGPRTNTIVLASETIRDPINLTFQVIEIFMHYVIGHLRCGTYDFLPEYRRDCLLPRQYLTPRYGEYEGKARNATSCLWSDTYSESLLSAVGTLRAALRRPGVTPELVRFATDDKSSFRNTIHDWLNRSHDILVDRLGGPPSFSGPVAIVKAPDDADINVYLLQAVRSVDGTKQSVCRRWIPSESVLHRLGMSLGDVVRVPWDTIVACPEETMLIDPEEVSRIREVLATTRKYSLLNRIRGYNAHLEGIFRGRGESDTPGDTHLQPPYRRIPLPLRFRVNRP